jgi:CheY-like chemotaxis protein
MTEEDRQEAINNEKDRLFNWETSQDPQAFSNILADLYSPEKEIRMAAIDATEQVHNTNAIPVLKAIAVTNQDSEEQMALFDAANFIALPQGSLNGGSPSTLRQ